MRRMTIGFAVVILSALIVCPLSARAGVLCDYEGSIGTSARAEDVTDSQVTPITGAGDYSAAAEAKWCDAYQNGVCIGASCGSNATATATLNSDGFSTEMKCGGWYFDSSMGYGSRANLTLDFSVVRRSSWDLVIDATGRISVELTNVDGTSPLYSLQFASPWPGKPFEGVVPLTLETGDYSLELMCTHFDREAGHVLPGTLLVDFVSKPVIPIPGDLDGDGFVNSRDLDIVRAWWGESVDPGNGNRGDANGDGLVNSADLDIVHANWGAGSATVPEPIAGLFVLVGAVFAAFQRRR